MKKKILRGIGLATLVGSALYAQDIVGDWRGTLKAGPAELRLALHIQKGESGLTLTMDSLDQGANGIPGSSVTLQGGELKFNIDPVHGTYEGKVSADGAAIKGTWSQGQPLPLDFERGVFKKVEHKPGKPSDIDGTWSGRLALGPNGLGIVFHIANMEDGLMATADSPDQGANGFPVTAVTRDGTSIKFEMKAQAAQFEGKISEDRNTITGTFTQIGNGMPLVLTRVKEAEKK
jgi:hypothetical protein